MWKRKTKMSSTPPSEDMEEIKEVSAQDVQAELQTLSERVKRLTADEILLKAEIRELYKKVRAGGYDVSEIASATDAAERKIEKRKKARQEIVERLGVLSGEINLLARKAG